MYRRQLIKSLGALASVAFAGSALAARTVAHRSAREMLSEQVLLLGGQHPCGDFSVCCFPHGAWCRSGVVARENCAIKFKNSVGHDATVLITVRPDVVWVAHNSIVFDDVTYEMMHEGVVVGHIHVSPQADIPGYVWCKG
jgi:hypothetical protein